MTVSRDEVARIAKLAKLEFTDEEQEKFTHQLNDVLKYVEKLDELDTSDVEPLTQVGEPGSVTREDTIRPSLPIEDVLANAPAVEGRFFSVPNAIGER